MNECKLVEDLLPLYAEDLVSPETKEFVDTHCARCESCEKLRVRAVQPVPETPVDAKAYKKSLRKEIILTSLKGSVYAIVVVLAIALAIAAGAVPMEDPVVYESPDGIHSIQFRYWGGIYGFLEGMEVKEVWKNGWSQGGYNPWNEIVDVTWSPDGTCAFMTMEMLNGETGMYISANKYSEEGCSSWWYPERNGIGKNYWNLSDVLNEQCALQEDFPSGWENVSFGFVSWAADNETITLTYETSNGYTGALDFNFITETITAVNQ